MSTLIDNCQSLPSQNAVYGEFRKYSNTSMDNSTNFETALVNAIEYVSKFVVPLYLLKNSKPELLGSGFFIQWDNKLALVSAAHVLNKASNTNPLYLYRSPTDLIPVEGKRFLSCEKGIDIALILTKNISLPWPAVNKFACRLEYLHAQRTPRGDKHYVIVGYPCTKNRVNPLKQTVKAAMHAYHANSIPDAQYLSYGLDPADNVALPLDLKKGVDPAGNRIIFPKPNGMSGSPIWELFDESNGVDQPRTFPLVAVGTNYKNKILHGTDIRHLLSKLSNL